MDIDNVLDKVDKKTESIERLWTRWTEKRTTLKDRQKSSLT